MRALVYEGRRLIGIRSSWIILLATLAGSAAVSAVTARQSDTEWLSTAASVRLLTAALPLLPLPLAAFGAGALGALSYGHEVRHSALRASLVSPARRLRLLVAKLAVIGAAAVVLALGSLAVDAAVLYVALPSGNGLGGIQHPDRLPPVMLAFTVLVVAAGWVALLAAGLARSTAGGLLVLLALPTMVEPAVEAVLRRSGAAWASRVPDLMPFRAGGGWVYTASHSAHGLFTAAFVGPVAVALLPAAVLLPACVAVQLGRRAV